MAEIESITKDPCAKGYTKIGRKSREIHVNLQLKIVRVYFRKKQTRNKGNQYTHTDFVGIISGPATENMARSSNTWCDMFQVSGKRLGPTPHGLKYFVLICPRREIGFHSDHYIKNGDERKIPGKESAGCIRIPKESIERFFGIVRKGDCVRFYKRPFWREPTFANCSINSHCSPQKNK